MLRHSQATRTALRGEHRFQMPVVAERPARPTDRRRTQPLRPHGCNDLGTLVHAAGDGDRQAWEELVRRFDPAVRAVARRHRLSSADQDEVSQETWLSLLRRIHSIRDPAALGGWLATTARNESLRVLSCRRALALDSSEAADQRDGVALDEQVCEQERRAALHRALADLPHRQRLLMWTLVTQPALGYEQLGAALGMPVGSIGPTRQRSLTRLRRDPALLRALQA